VSASSSLMLTAMNSGTAALDITSATITSGGSDFVVTGGSTGMQSVPMGMSTPPWTIRCAPTVSGTRMGNFRIVSNSFMGGTTNVSLTCNGQQGVLATTPATTPATPIDFGGVTVGNTATQMFVLRNPGNVA